MTEPRTLHVFDIDGTLFNTDAYVRIMQGKTLVRKLGHGEFNTHKLNPGEDYDFQEFRSGQTFRDTAKPVGDILDRAKQIVRMQHETSKTILLTARSGFKDVENFKQTFRDHGFPIDKIDVFMSGNLSRLNKNASTPLSKATMLKPYVLSNKYDKIYVWDDSKENLEILIKLEKYNPKVRIIGYWIDKMGRVSEYNAHLTEAIKIPGESLNISRDMMPQLGKNTPHFMRELKAQGINHSLGTAMPRELKATQADFSHDIIKSLMARKPALNPIIVSHDNYILDGHHRWLAAYNTDKDKPIPVLKVHTGILDLLHKAKTYKKVEYRSLKDSETRSMLRKTIKESVTARLYK